MTFEEAISALREYPRRDKAELVEAIHVIRDGWDGAVDDKALLWEIRETLLAIKWHTRFIFGMRHDFDNPGVVACDTMFRHWDDFVARHGLDFSGYKPVQSVGAALLFSHVATST